MESRQSIRLAVTGILLLALSLGTGASGGPLFIDAAEEAPAAPEHTCSATEIDSLVACSAPCKKVPADEVSTCAIIECNETFGEIKEECRDCVLAIVLVPEGTPDEIIARVRSTCRAKKARKTAGGP